MPDDTDHANDHNNQQCFKTEMSQFDNMLKKMALNSKMDTRIPHINKSSEGIQKNLPLFTKTLSETKALNTHSYDGFRIPNECPDIL